MRRSDFIVGVLLAGSAMTRKRAALARDGRKIPRVGYLGTNIGPASLPPIEAFREGLRQLGYTEGQNIIVEYRWAQGPADAAASAHAAELVGLDLDLAVARTPLMLRCSGEQATRSQSSSALVLTPSPKASSPISHGPAGTAPV